MPLPIFEKSITFHLSASALSLLLLLAAANLFEMTVCGMAWWTLGKRTRSARIWAIAASLANVPQIVIGPPMWISTAAGVLGLIVFSRRDALVGATANKGKPVRVAGDGANRLTDTIASVIAYGGTLCGCLWWDRWGFERGLSILPSIPGFAMAVLAGWIVIAVHEFGHVGTGWALGMKLRSFVVGPFHWRIRDGRSDFSFRVAGLLSGGAAGLAPTDAQDRPWCEVCMIAAGPAANFLFGSMALAAALTAKGQFWEPLWEFFALIATFSLAAFIINLLPLRPKVEYSDGARIYHLLRGGPSADVRRAWSLIASCSASPLRPKDFDIDTLQRAARAVAHGPAAVWFRVYAYAYFFESDRSAEALAAIQEAELIYKQSAPDIPGGLCADFVFANGFLKHDATGAREWWERLEAAKVSPSTSDYWKARGALLLSENRLELAHEAWEKGNALAQKLPATGASEFERYCFAQLRTALDALLEESAAIPPD